MRRHLPTLLTVLALGGLLWSFITIATPARVFLPDEKSSRVLDQQLKTTANEIARVSRLANVLAAIDRLPGTGAPTDIVAERHDKALTPGGKRDEDGTPLDISLVYLSSTIQKVAIDGQLYGPGDLLPDGIRVISISPARLVLSGKDGRQILKFARANALGTSPMLEHRRKPQDAALQGSAR